MRNGINQRSGAHIVIENNTKIPSIVSRGLSVMPGTETNIGLTSKKIRRLRQPFKSNCTDEFDAERVSNITGNWYRYSSTICKGMCYGSIFFEVCGCVHPSFIEGVLLERWASLAAERVRICNVIEGSDDYVCSNTTGFRKVGEENVCDCNPECYEGKYRVRFLIILNTCRQVTLTSILPKFVKSLLYFVGPNINKSMASGWILASIDRNVRHCL